MFWRHSLKGSLMATKSSSESILTNQIHKTKQEGPLLFISAGDPSGDVHAEKLVKAISRRLPGVRFIGFAGPKTAETVCDVRFDLTQYAAMMLKKALVNIPVYFKLLSQADRIFREEKPDAVILVDFPGFNFRIAQKAKAAGILVIYFMPPQIWGWGQWRVKKMRKYVDLVLSCFEFEHEWFSDHGCRSVFVSHPFFEESRSRTLNHSFIDELTSKSSSSALGAQEQGELAPSKKKYLIVLPGSRDQEVKSNLPFLLSILKKVREKAPDVHPIFAAYRPEQAEYISQRLSEYSLDYSVYAEKTPELLRVATCCLGVSGSVSIEALSLHKPLVVIYKISRLEYFALRFLKRVKFITLTNLLWVHSLKDETPFYPKGKFASQTEYTKHERDLMICPEYLFFDSRQIKNTPIHLINWFSNPNLLEDIQRNLIKLQEETDLVEKPIEQAAEIIIHEAQSR